MILEVSKHVGLKNNTRKIDKICKGFELYQASS